MLQGDSAQTGAHVSDIGSVLCFYALVGKVYKSSAQDVTENWGDVAALLRSHMIGLLPFESTIEQATETMPLCLTQ